MEFIILPVKPVPSPASSISTDGIPSHSLLHKSSESFFQPHSLYPSQLIKHQVLPILLPITFMIHIYTLP